MGTFPADNPDYVVLIIVDEPGGASYYGSIAATPYAKMIIEDIIEYKDYKPSGDLIGDIIKTNEAVIMPDCVGKDIDSALYLCESIGLQVEIEGENEIVSSQFPVPESEVIKNGIVVLKTD